MKNKKMWFAFSVIILFICFLLISGCYGGQYQDFADKPKGYSVQLPSGMTVDDSIAESYTKYISPDMEVFLSKEKSPYEDVLYYIDYFIDRFITSPTYQQKNKIKLNCHTVQTVNDKNVKVLSVTRTPYPGSIVELNTYTYIYLYDTGDSRDFHRIMVKSRDYDKAAIDNIIASFKVIPVEGEAKNTIDTTPSLPKWNAETKAFYENLCNRQDVMWGIFMPDAVTVDGYSNAIPDLEDKLSYNFPLCMQYSHLPHDPPPLEGLKQAYADGKITELSLQTATLWNNDLENSVNPNLEIIDGVRDKEITAYAQAVKEFGHPVLMRINNEMNTDWTSYAGVQTMGDPEIYKAVYNRIYDIFAQQGVDNAIWVFNPQMGDSPPASFNNFMSYFPGADRVQVLGLTAYNSGEYYKDVEDYLEWKSFSELYDRAQTVFEKNFSDYPWVIGEFGSDSHGGNKENWITNMFNEIGNYKNIKGAIWLNWEAYDARKGSFGNVSRCYRLDETDATLKAFKDGLHGVQPRTKMAER